MDIIVSRQSREIDAAIEVFVRGFAAGKSLTHPYEVGRVSKVWFMRDAARRNPRNDRKEEWVAFGVPPHNVHAIAQENTRGRYVICDVLVEGVKDAELRAAYKELGYRLLGTEALFVHRLKRIPRASSSVKIARVRTQKMAVAYGKATRSRPLMPEQLANDAPFRQYVALERDTIVGRVRSIDAGSSTWCSDLHVLEDHRRRGIGKALMGRMLRDDRSLRAESNVLLASHAGALLYSHLGFEKLGMLYIFAPKKA